MLPNDVACDFCGRDWDIAQPMYAGADDAMICRTCLHMAYGHLFRLGLDDAHPGWVCTLCKEHRKGKAWPSPLLLDGVICARCVRRGAKRMEADPNSGWRRP